LPVQLRQLAPRGRRSICDTDADWGSCHHATTRVLRDRPRRRDAPDRRGVASVVQRGCTWWWWTPLSAYRSRTFFDDLLLVDTLPPVGGVRFAFGYEIPARQRRSCVASGQTVHAGVDAHTLRPVPCRLATSDSAVVHADMTVEPISVELTDAAFGGEAIGHLPDGRVVSCPRALPGETALVRVQQERRDFARASLLG